MPSDVKIPGPDHPITIEAEPGRVIVHAGDRVLADCTDALVLHEAGHEPVHYVPLVALEGAMLRGSETTTWCPYKGTAAYYDVDEGDGDWVADAVWYYPDAFPAVAEITGHAAFYPDRVRIEVRPAD